MFEHETVGIGAEEEHVQVVLGLVDEHDRIIGWFGKEYHPNMDMVDSIGALDPPLRRPRIVIGVSDGEETYVIGGLGGFLKKIGRAVAAPITAPVKAAVAIAQGKNVIKSIAKSVVAPVTTSLQLARATAAPVVRTASAIARPLVGKKVARGLTNVTLGPMTTAAQSMNLLAQGKIAKALKTSVVQPLTQGKSLVAPSLSLAKPILKSPVTAAIVTGVALAFPPVGIPLAAGYAALRTAVPYAQMALAASDKVLAAAKGTLPAMKAAPPDVAKALQNAAKLTIAKTYQAANLGSQDAQRAVQVLVAARRVQQTIPAAQAAIHPSATLAEGSKATAPIVAKGSGILRGTWQKVSKGATHDGPMVLPNGVVVRGGWRAV